MVFLVDYENVNYAGLAGVEYLDNRDKVTLFYSEGCRLIPSFRTQQIIDSGCEFDICDLVVKRNDALDYYIATKVGEVLVRYPDENVAIVSKDKGFRSVCDYWNFRAVTKQKIVLDDTMTKCIMAADSGRRKDLVCDDQKTIELVDFIQEYKKRESLRRVKDGLEAEFAGTEDYDLIPWILHIVEQSMDMKSMYLNTIKFFGRETGLDVYRCLKKVV